MLDAFLRLTWYNPIFMIVLISVIWFVPGILVRRILEKKQRLSKAEKQAEAIARLYPKKINK